MKNITRATRAAPIISSRIVAIFMLIEILKLIAAGVLVESII
jgi:hypothetical protein